MSHEELEWKRDNHGNLQASRGEWKFTIVQIYDTHLAASALRANDQGWPVEHLDMIARFAPEDAINTRDVVERRLKQAVRQFLSERM